MVTANRIASAAFTFGAMVCIIAGTLTTLVWINFGIIGAGWNLDQVLSGLTTAAIGWLFLNARYWRRRAEAAERRHVHEHRLHFSGDPTSALDAAKRYHRNPVRYVR